MNCDINTLKSRLEKVSKPIFDMDVSRNFIAVSNLTKGGLEITTNCLINLFLESQRNISCFNLYLHRVLPFTPVVILDKLGLLPSYVFYDKTPCRYIPHPHVYICSNIVSDFKDFKTQMKTFKLEGKVERDITKTNTYRDAVKGLDFLRDSISYDVVRNHLLDYIDEDADVEFIHNLLKERINYFCYLLAETTLFYYEKEIKYIITRYKTDHDKVENFFTIENLKDFFSNFYKDDSIIDGKALGNRWINQKENTTGY